jgi:hypothetical protein
MDQNFLFFLAGALLFASSCRFSSSLFLSAFSSAVNSRSGSGGGFGCFDTGDGDREEADGWGEGFLALFRVDKE